MRKCPNVETRTLLVLHDRAQSESVVSTLYSGLAGAKREVCDHRLLRDTSAGVLLAVEGW